MKIPFGPSQGLRDVESDTNDEMKEYDDGWQVEENSYKMLVKDIQPLSYQEVAEDWENNFEHKRLMIKCCKCPATSKKHVNRKMHERTCQIVAPPQTGTGLSQDDHDEQDDDDFCEEKSALKGVVRVYSLEFCKNSNNLYPRIKKAFENAYNSIKKLQRDEKNMKYILSLKCNFYKPTQPGVITDPPVVFNSETCSLLSSSDLDYQNINFNSL